MVTDERRKEMARCYVEATKRLRKEFHKDFHAFLQEAYEEAGINIRQRLTPQMKLERDIANARALLAQHGVDSSD
jgi:hypothetical protein